uniref:Nuclear pore complex interacting protein N-terminal domain-containing protein n=1 Tax=Cercocebus atys TaxID=9531 RepID=A0A2K5M6S6_CERAT
MRVRWQLFWLLLLGFLSHQSTYVINSLPDHFQPGPDFFGIPWIAIIIVFLGISTLGIFLWKTSFGVSIRTFWLRSTCTHTKKKVSSFPGIKIAWETFYFMEIYEAKVRAEVHKVTTDNRSLPIHGQREDYRGRVNVKMFQDMQQLQWRAEDSYRCKITPYARKALDNWVSLFVFLAFGHSLPGQDVDVFFSPQLCAQALQREMAERKAAYKQHGPVPLGNCVVLKHLHPHPVVPLI